MVGGLRPVTLGRWGCGVPADCALLSPCCPPAAQAAELEARTHSAERELQGVRAARDWLAPQLDAALTDKVRGGGPATRALVFIEPSCRPLQQPAGAGCAGMDWAGKAKPSGCPAAH